MEKKQFTKDELNKLTKEDLIKLLISQQNTLCEMGEKIEFLMDQVKLSNAGRFGRSSEKNILADQLCIFNEAESLLDEAQASEEPDLEEITYKRKKKAGKREEDLSALPVKIEEHVISEDILAETFPEGYERFPDEVYRKLSYQPAVFEVIEHHIAVYHGKKGGIIRADHPTELLESSIATPSLCAGIMNAKYVNALPLYRIEQEFKRRDIHLSRQVMSGWMIKLAERYLSLIYDKMRAHLLSESVIHADETPVRVNKDGRKAGSKSYMWVYRSGEKNAHPVVLYDYCKTRKAEHPEEFLEGFSGYVVSDGYAVYHRLAEDHPKGIKVCGCWVHARRRFADIVKSSGGSDKRKAKYTLAAYAIEQISQLYDLEKTLKDLSPFERQKERNLTLKPRIEAFFAWAKAHYGEVPQESNIGKALNYVITQEKYLSTFLEDGDIPLDNNAAERAIRPFCIGKKNWVMIDTVHGAESSAVIYSIAETAKANGIKPYEYFKYLLTEIPKHMDETSLDFLDYLLPWASNLPKEYKVKETEETKDAAK